MADGNGERRDLHKSHRLEIWHSPANRIKAVAVLLSAVVIAFFWLREQGWGDVWEVAKPWQWCIAGLLALVAFWFSLYLLFRPRMQLDHLLRPVPLFSQSEYDAVGLGRLPADADPRHLYLDQVKRAVCNIIYEDPPFWYYDGTEPVLAHGFSLERRARGEDSPTEAHTMIGIQRLNSLQSCIEQVVDKGIAGDLIETGSFRGGATIFMRAVLKSLQIDDRRVFVCDTFVPPSPAQPALITMPFIQALAAIPSRAWQRQFFMFLQKLPKRYQAFPDLQNPSDDFIQFVMWNLRNPVAFNFVERTNLERVRSNFARYGLLDDQVVFLEGFFADTLPAAPIEKLALVRLDGDTYESTWDAITLLYPKLSPGGYLIVDDYQSFSDCERAIQEYRRQHDIRDEIVPIDNLAVYWRKS